MAETRANPGLTPNSPAGRGKRLHPMMKKKIARGKRVRATTIRGRKKAKSDD